MRTPPTFNWSPSIFTFIFIFIFPFILVCAAPAPEVDSQDHTPIATLFPRLIVPVKEEFRDEAYNTMFTGDIRYTPSAGNEIRLFGMYASVAILSSLRDAQLMLINQ